MNRFNKKFKKSNLSARLVYLFVSIIFILSYIYLFKELTLLTGIETKIRIFVLSISGSILVIYLISNLLLLLSKKNMALYIISFICLLLSGALTIGSMSIDKIYNLINKVNKTNVEYTTNLITLKDTELSSTSVIGIINNESDAEGNILAYKLIEKEKLTYSIEKYDTYFELLEKLYDKSIDGIFITSNYVSKYNGYEISKNIEEDVKVQYEYSEFMENQDYYESTASVTEPFSVLIMGVDSKYDGLNKNAAFNGDTLMLITFNPKTLTSTIFSIPRDTYVPIACINGSSKINSSAAYGTKCVISTIEQLTGITIDYYVKINFKGVVSLVDALNGIDITVPDKIDFCEQDSNRSFKKENLICIKSGYQHMNGEQALAFARHRKTLPRSDFQRVQHQQLVIEGIAESVKNLSSLGDFYKVLETISKNMDTNMSTKEILNLYNVIKKVVTGGTGNSMINIQKTNLTGYDLTMYVENLRSTVYTFQYYKESLDEIVKALKINLELIEPTPITTFSFSANKKYEAPVIGKINSTIQKKETLPSFVGNTLEYAKSWLIARNITVNVNYVESASTSGTIIAQNVLKNKLVTEIKEITLTVAQ